MEQARDVRAFWIDEVGPAGWYVQDTALDAEIRNRFLPLWEQALDGGLCDWRMTPEGMLSYLILTDQFPRNMFRGDGRSFATDGLALCAAKWAVARGWDQQIDEPARQFFFLPMMHSEVQTDQDQAVRLFATRMTTGDNLRHARAHREVIRRFGRFPYRNDALGRAMRHGEQGFLDAGAYGSILNEPDFAA
ncbi:MAG: hypothetical protein CSA72_09935 [Rhodobacterales bacterium]|nr:MAG: hypothetical protein CSA72_09935 [Rhodobacterales bacterium]